MDKVLIVDDEDAMRNLLRLNLEDRYKVFHTGDSTEALAIAMREKPNVILLDLRMPNYSGFELCRTFSSMTATQLIPFVIVSGESGESVRALCKDLGARAFFGKPVDYDALREGLAEILRTVQPERRAEQRVRLRVRVKLRGTDADGKPFEEVSATENVGQRSFLCGCTAPLAPEAGVDVSLAGGGSAFTGSARVVRSEERDTPYPRYAFRFVQKDGEWVLKR